MKIKTTLVVMSLLGSLTQATKLLKVPRIYNALITSDENLQPSQAYPALAPVVQGIQYPLPGYVSSNVYRMLVIPNQVQYSDTRSYSYSVHNSVKEDYYHYNIVETGRPFKFDIPKITSSSEEKELEQPTLFRPIVPVQDEKTGGIDTNDNRVVYFESSPVQQIDNVPRPNLIGHPSTRFQNPQNRNEETNPSDTDGNVDTSTLPESSDDSSPSADVENPKTEPRFGRLPEIEDLVKNYRPKDTSIVDVPPPPVPVSRKTKIDKKSDRNKVEEYPPPPVGFF